MDAGAVVAVLGLMSAMEMRAADEVSERMPDNGTDKFGAELRGLMWAIYNDALCDVVRVAASDDYSSLNDVFDRRREAINGFIESGVNDAKAREFREELDAYGRD